MEKHTDRILWTVLVLALGVSLYSVGKPAFSNIVHASIQHLSHLTKQWDGASLDDVSDSDFSYSEPNTIDHTISIVGYSGYKENLTIPQYHKIGSVSYKVTAIGDKAFYRNARIKQVTIPDGVISIGDDAFEQTNITSVNLPAGLTSIGNSVFANTPLTSVNLPASLTSIGNYAFYNTPLTSVDFPAGVTSIGDGAFQNTSLTSVDFPASLKSIGRWAFEYTKLTSVNLPAGLTSIDDGAFANTPISAISFKQRVDLGVSSFENTNLTNVTLPTGSTYKTDANAPTFDSDVTVTIK